MTALNHPAHGPLSLDRLHQISEILSKAAAQSDGGNLGYAMADAVKVIDVAIALFSAEPVEINDDMAYAFHHALSDSSLGSDEIEEIKTGLRAAFANITVQPVLIVPDEIEPDDSNTFDYVDGWNACRAAMLQGKVDDEVGSWNNHKNTPTAKPVSEPDKLPTISFYRDGIRALHPNAGMPPAPVVPDSANGLMPCPFCGGKARQLTIEQDNDPHFGGDVITCTECGASSHVEFGFKENLKSAWNSRAAMIKGDAK